MTTAKLLVLMSVLGLSHPATATAAETSTPKVMIVGVAHLASKRDAHNSVFTDSPLSPKRQAQVAEIVDRLATFHPTEVLIESDHGDPKMPERYRDFLVGRFKLGENEVYQFGFNLAARAGNPAIYGVDADGPRLIDDKTDAGKRQSAYLQANFAKVEVGELERFIAGSDELERNGTYLDLPALSQHRRSDSRERVLVQCFRGRGT